MLAACVCVVVFLGVPDKPFMMLAAFLLLGWSCRTAASVVACLRQIHVTPEGIRKTPLGFHLRWKEIARWSVENAGDSANFYPHKKTRPKKISASEAGVPGFGRFVAEVRMHLGNETETP
ncbi:hypothetical protein OH491_11705 [Termitidicoccus mucosus]